MKLPYRSVNLLLKPQTSRSGFICHRCQNITRTSPFSTARHRQAPNNDPAKPPEDALVPAETSESQSEPPDKPAFGSRMRRRIWGTDNPPGQKDPYARLTPEEHAAEVREQAAALEQEQSSAQAAAEEIKRQQAAGEYLPADTWTGLERIGGPTGWWEEEWDRNNTYRGFLTEGVLSEDQRPADPRDLVRRVVVEVMALQRAGLTLHSAAQAEWADDELVEDIDIVQAEDGSFALREQMPDLIDELIEHLQRDREEEAVETMLSEAENAAGLSQEQQQRLDELHKQEDAAAAEILASSSSDPDPESSDEETPASPSPIVASTKQHDPIFLSMVLPDLSFKFALIKRLTYLTGQRITDPAIARFSTVGDVVSHLSQKDTPAKLADILLEQPQLAALPNVEIRAGKRTFVHREMEVGRWKVIEAELRRRGLPVRKSERISNV